MAEVVSFLVTNYVWILVIVIVTLLAIIGSYANKTNFGEGEKKEEIKKDEEPKYNNIENVTLNEALGTKSEKQNKQAAISNESSINSVQENSVNDIGNAINTIDNQNNTNVSNNSIESDEKNLSENKDSKSKDLFKSIEDKLSNLDSELNSILPQKKVINNNLLEDIEDMSIDTEDKPNKKIFNDIKTSDIDLPEIKSLKEKDEDIWNRKKQ